MFWLQDKEYLEGRLTVAVQDALSYSTQLTAARLKLAGQYTCIINMRNAREEANFKGCNSSGPSIYFIERNKNTAACLPRQQILMSSNNDPNTWAVVKLLTFVFDFLFRTCSLQ